MNYSRKPVRVMDFRGTYKGGGGPDKTILNSAVLHDSSRIFVLVTYLRDPLDTEYSIDSWAKRLNVNYVDVPDSKLLDIRCIQRLKHLIDVHDIHLIHAHDDKTLLYGLILKVLRPSVSIMFTCHLHSMYTKSDFHSSMDYLRFNIRKKIVVGLMRFYQKPVLAVSGYTMESLVAEGFKKDHVAVLHNGIDSDIWRKENGRPVLREELHIPDNCMIVGTVARIAQKHKDLPSFYEVAADVHKRLPNVRFVIVGDGHGRLLEDAQRIVAGLGLKDVIHFTGHRTDLLDIYASFDLFLMTSRTEGLPNTVLEAMAMEVPVVSTRVAGVPELITNDETGQLCPIGDVDGLADRVFELLNDENKREKIAKKARQRIDADFSFKNRVLALEDYYEHFIN